MGKRPGRAPRKVSHEPASANIQGKMLKLRAPPTQKSSRATRGRVQREKFERFAGVRNVQKKRNYVEKPTVESIA